MFQSIVFGDKVFVILFRIVARCSVRVKKLRLTMSRIWPKTAIYVKVNGIRCKWLSVWLPFELMSYAFFV